MYSRREVALEKADEAAIREALRTAPSVLPSLGGVVCGIALSVAAFPIAMNPNAGASVLAAALMLLGGVSLAACAAYMGVARWRERSEDAGRSRSCRESLDRGLVEEIRFVAEAAWRVGYDDDDGQAVLYRVSSGDFVYLFSDTIDDGDPSVPASWLLRRTLGPEPVLLRSQADAEHQTIRVSGSIHIDLTELLLAGEAGESRQEGALIPAASLARVRGSDRFGR